MKRIGFLFALMFLPLPALAGAAEEYLDGAWHTAPNCGGDKRDEFRFVEGRLHTWNEMDEEFNRLAGVAAEGQLIRTTVRFEGLADIVVTYRKLDADRMRMWKVVDKGTLQFDNGVMGNGDKTEVLYRCRR